MTGAPCTWDLGNSDTTYNPHVLIIGESGTGKTYAISSLLFELSRRGIHPVVFDYAQGFSADQLGDEFLTRVPTREVNAARDGISINPLQIFESDVNGPLNVAQRVADTLGRVYARIGIQQHALLRDCIIELLESCGVLASRPSTWDVELPAFSKLKETLASAAEDSANPRRSVAATVLSHISTLFVFNTFRAEGETLDWPRILGGTRSATIIRLKGLEYSLEKAATELMLWSLLGYLESVGPGSLRAFVVLDEAHRLSFEEGSPVAKILREGRKFGIGVILASQQPEDFSSVAFGNTATKLVFQTNDEHGQVTRNLYRKVTNFSFDEISACITKLPRGRAFCVSGGRGSIVQIPPIRDRFNADTTWTKP